MNKTVTYTPENSVSLLITAAAAASDKAGRQLKSAVLGHLDRAIDKLENGTFGAKEILGYLGAGAAFYWLCVLIGIPV